MTGTRRPLGIPPPSPNRENNSDEEANSEDEGGDINEEENSDTSGSESGSNSSIDREIRSFEERNRELAERIREVEEDRLHHVEIQEGWRRAIVALEAKLCEMRAVVEVAQGGGAAVAQTTLKGEMVDGTWTGCHSRSRGCRKPFGSSQCEQMQN